MHIIRVYVITLTMKLLWFVCVFISPIIAEDYVQYKDVGMEYKLHKNFLSWPEARKVCAGELAELAMPRNQREADKIKEIFNSLPYEHVKNARKPNRIILGFHDLFKEGEYLLENGDTLQYAFRKWDRGEPNNMNKNENCGSMTREGLIDDFPCYVPSIFICQRQTDDYLSKFNEKCKTKDLAYKYFEHTKSCYKLHVDPKTWPEARAICKAEGGQLTIINSQEEETYLLGLINDPANIVEHVPHKCCALIGFHDLFKEGEYITVEGFDLKESGFNKWTKGNPSNSYGKENCGSLHKSGGLNDMYCDTPAPFICEIKISDDIDIRLEELGP